jgi:hypothetical protein
MGKAAGLLCQSWELFVSGRRSNDESPTTVTEQKARCYAILVPEYSGLFTALKRKEKKTSCIGCACTVSFLAINTYCTPA